MSCRRRARQHIGRKTPLVQVAGMADAVSALAMLDAMKAGLAALA
jgi:hypothetical protein